MNDRLWKAYHRLLHVLEVGYSGLLYVMLHHNVPPAHTRIISINQSLRVNILPDTLHHVTTGIVLRYDIDTRVPFDEFITHPAVQGYMLNAYIEPELQIPFCSTLYNLYQNLLSHIDTLYDHTSPYSVIEAYALLYRGVLMIIPTSRVHHSVLLEEL